MGFSNLASSAFLLISFLLAHLPLLHSSQPFPHKYQKNSKCSHSFDCLHFGWAEFPFANTTDQECGLSTLNCTKDNPKVQLQKGGRWFDIKDFDFSKSTITIHDPYLQNNLKSGLCDSLNNFTAQGSSVHFEPIGHTDTLTFLKCKRDGSLTSHSKFFPKFRSFTGCNDYYLFFYSDDDSIMSIPFVPENLSNSCSVVQLPVYGKLNPISKLEKLESLFADEFSLYWTTRQECIDCHWQGDHCADNNRPFECEHSANTTRKKGSSNLGPRIGIGVGVAVVGVLLLTCIAFILYKRRRKQQLPTSTFVSKNVSPDPSLKEDLEKGSTYFQTPIFSYSELEEATNNFDSSKELGDGGFGTVYHGKLHDGRVVAVKRLYENNFKRVEQFMNEIAILSRIRHQNLVSLYGCTSRHCRELLLVYEFIPNGTVADHLHGERTKPGLVTWPIRMNIAIESADALSYLHASDIIHRDVKTNNILLDNSFHVKVADFGLSRLFPTDVTHVSTAPQGTPGYVDPEYYQCYQLTDKSDVYSFGVVLIELISSKPAVDVNRHRHEINLANMAINKIQNHALHELVDPYLRFESDYAVRMMITSVAELAFRCLQQDREMRPSMVEVLEVLRGIQSEEYKMEKAEEVDIPADDVGLLKNMPPPSPDSVTEKWISISTTPNASC